MLVIRGKVLNVEKFLPDHPGGPEVLVNLMGKDATQDFDQIGHSAKAKKLMSNFKVGIVNEPGVEVKEEDFREQWEIKTEEAKPGDSTAWWKYAVSIAIVIVALIVMKKKL